MSMIARTTLLRLVGTVQRESVRHHRVIPLPDPMPYTTAIWRKRFPYRNRTQFEVTHDEVYTKDMHLKTLEERRQGEYQYKGRLDLCWRIICRIRSSTIASGESKHWSSLVAQHSVQSGELCPFSTFYQTTRSCRSEEITLRRCSYVERSISLLIYTLVSVLQFDSPLTKFERIGWQVKTTATISEPLLIITVSSMISSNMAISFLIFLCTWTILSTMNKSLRSTVEIDSMPKM